MELIIGPSTGWLYGENIKDVNEHRKIIEAGGGNSVEISLRDNGEINKNLLKFSSVNWFKYKFAHIPEFGTELIDKWIIFLKEFHEVWNCDNYTIHPSMIEKESDWGKFKDSGLPIAIENMDKNKNSGFEIKELKRILKEYNFNFVLDLEHAYSHDKSMRYARELFDEFKDKITHVHVSGEADGVDHVLVKDSDNKKEIIEFLKGIVSEVNVPIIIEGKYSSSDDLKEEFDFIRGSLSH
ncbi:hypothetical protein KAS08_04055 [Candidatus Pacearchaeota archaeon]|nr:hypothetical protein [Candidatus Pacearchaeota archaeon]